MCRGYASTFPQLTNGRPEWPSFDRQFGIKLGVLDPNPKIFIHIKWTYFDLHGFEERFFLQKSNFIS
jgi:hypothetical protein